MASSKQIAANRLNGLTGGVKTQEGKSRSRLNSLKHGFFATSPLIRSIYCNEDPRKFDRLRKQMMKEHNPVHIDEIDCIHEMADIKLKQSRLRDHDVRALNRKAHDLDDFVTREVERLQNIRKAFENQLAITKLPLAMLKRLPLPIEKLEEVKGMVIQKGEEAKNGKSLLPEALLKKIVELGPPDKMDPATVLGVYIEIREAELKPLENKISEADEQIEKKKNESIAEQYERMIENDRSNNISLYRETLQKQYDRVLARLFLLQDRRRKRAQDLKPARERKSKSTQSAK